MHVISNFHSTNEVEVERRIRKKELAKLAKKAEELGKRVKVVQKPSKLNKDKSTDNNSTTSNRILTPTKKDSSNNLDQRKTKVASSTTTIHKAPNNNQSKDDKTLGNQNRPLTRSKSMNNLAQSSVSPELFREKVKIPVAISEYNMYMRGVDRFDQIASYYCIKLKSYTWYMKILFHFMEIAMANSYILYKTICEKRNLKFISRLSFRKSVIESLLRDFRMKKGVPTTIIGQKRKSLYTLLPSKIECELLVYLLNQERPKIVKFVIYASLKGGFQRKINVRQVIGAKNAEIRCMLLLALTHILNKKELSL